MKVAGSDALILIELAQRIVLVRREQPVYFADDAIGSTRRECKSRVSTQIVQTALNSTFACELRDAIEQTVALVKTPQRAIDEQKQKALLLLVNVFQIGVAVQPLFVKLQKGAALFVSKARFAQRRFHIAPQLAD